MQVTLSLLRSQFESWKHLNENLTPQEIHETFEGTLIGKPLPPKEAQVLVQSQENFEPVNVEGFSIDKDTLVKKLDSVSRYFYVVRTGEDQFDIFHTRMFLDREETKPAINLDNPLQPFNEEDKGKVYLLGLPDS